MAVRVDRNGSARLVTVRAQTIVRSEQSDAVWSRATGALLAGVVVVVCARLFGRYALDDSFIGYANAQNLAHGLGFAFNPGDRLLTTSAPLVVPIYAFLDRFFGVSEVWSAQVLSAISYCAIAFYGFVLARRITGSRWAALATSLVFILSPPVLLMWSHETLVWIALVLAGIELVFEDRVALAALVLGVSMLARQETVLVLPFVAYGVLRRRGAREAALAVTIALVPFALWSLYALPTFGSVVSHSVSAKHAQLLTQGYPYLNGLFSAIGLLYRFAMPPALFLLATCAVAFGLVFPLVSGSMLEQWRWVVAWALVVTAFYVAVQVHFFVWFAVQTAVLIALAVAAQAAFVVRARAPSAARRSPLVVPAALGALVIVAAHVSFLATLLIDAHLTVDYDDLLVMPEIGANNYYKLARFVREHTRPTDSVAYPEIGQLRFYSGRRIVDYVGLATPGVSEHALAADTIWTFERYRPDVFVDAVGNWQYIVAPLEYPWFDRAYARGESAQFAPVALKDTFVLYHLTNPSAIPAPEEIDRRALIDALPGARPTFAIRSDRSLSAIDMRVDASACAGTLRLSAPGYLDRTVAIARLPYAAIVRERIEIPIQERKPGLAYRLTLAGCPSSAIRPPQLLRSGFVLWERERPRGNASTAIDAYYPSPPT